ncbi:hypothetical protein [Hyphomicrobium sp.]|uniref:hypothetical protein n=1 Tax=Hyphomicrobium sp. TaxID=82 RepID=UPI000FA8D42F|nr:hypothetical protein [Hyphomicrobium sp.]RUO99476.1 MAG: hypothetical protein EKK30_06160 [Hyphomicrobium sp.]
MADRWCLLTSYDSGFSEIAALATPAMRRYANRYAMEFQEAIDGTCGRPPAWSKLYPTRQCFDEGI